MINRVEPMNCVWGGTRGRVAQRCVSEKAWLMRESSGGTADNLKCPHSSEHYAECPILQPGDVRDQDSVAGATARGVGQEHDAQERGLSVVLPHSLYMHVTQNPVSAFRCTLTSGLYPHRRSEILELPSSEPHQLV